MRSKEEILADKVKRQRERDMEEILTKDERNLNQSEGEWKFNEDVAPVFSDHVRASVPLYEYFHTLVEDLSVHFVEPETIVYDLGTSTGESIKRVYEKNKDRLNVGYVGYDNSLPMIEQCNAEGQHHISFQFGELTDENLYMKNASLITSVLTLQFLSIDKRESLVSRIYENLNKGGAFILIEKVMAEDPLIESIFATEYEKFKFNQGLSEEHIYKKKQSLKGVMKPITLERNQEMLRNAGFTRFETFFRTTSFAGIIAIK